MGKNKSVSQAAGQILPSELNKGSMHNLSSKYSANEFNRTFEAHAADGPIPGYDEGRNNQQQYQTNMIPQAAIRQKKFITAGNRTNSKPKTKGLKQRKLASQGENDMLLMNIRMNMHTQNG